MHANNPDLYKQLNRINIIPQMEAGGLLGAGRYIDVDSKKVHKFPAIDTNVNWIYTNPNPKLYCMEYQSIVKGFGFIPKRCLECWKVVVAPRSFHELMQLYDLEKEMVEQNPRCWCKCGTEVRDFIPRNFGGYFYTKGKEQGILRLETVRERVAGISPDIKIILKRYCTEFELRFGPSDQYVPPLGADEIEKRFWDNVDIQQGAVEQPKFVRDHVVQNWMLFAWGRGDMTATLYNNGEPLFKPSLTYEA